MSDLSGPVGSTPEYELDVARPQDLPFLPSIEKAAATLLRGYAPESVLESTTPQSVLEDAQTHARLWVVRTQGVPVGFAHVELLEPTVAHLQEIDVHPQHGRRGLGTRLVTAVCTWAARKKFQFVTLTTFRDVRFNMPFYRRLGFEVIAPEDLGAALTSIIEQESRRGLDASGRVAMRRRLSEALCQTVAAMPERLGNQ